MKNLILAFCLFLGLNAQAQQDSTTIWFAGGGNIYTIDLNTCISQFKCHTGKEFLDIAHTPNGKLYGNTADSLFEINTNGTTRTIGKIPVGNGLVGLNDSTLFIDSLRYLFAINTKDASRKLVGYTSVFVDGDFAWVNKELYVIGTIAISGDTIGARYLTKIRFNSSFDQIHAIDTVRLVNHAEYLAYGMTSIYLQNQSSYSLIGFISGMGSFVIDTSTAVYSSICLNEMASFSVYGASCMIFPKVLPTQIDESSTSNPLISIFPNPTVDKFNIEVSDLNKAAMLLLYDYTGKVIKKQLIKSRQETIDISPYSPGLYFVRLFYDDNRIYATKIVKL